jgi:hypothetical protein
VPCIIGHFMCHGKPLKEKTNEGGGGGVGWVGWGANRSSKAFGISFADRPKAKQFFRFQLFSCYEQLPLFSCLVVSFFDPIFDMMPSQPNCLGND